MSLTNQSLVRSEGRLIEDVTDAQLNPSIVNATTEIKKILSSELYSFGGILTSIYEITYANIQTILTGSYASLKTAINEALTDAGEDEITDWTDLGTACNDFQKAETYLALADAVVPLGTRATAGGGFIKTIPTQGGGDNRELMSLAELNKLKLYYAGEARRVLFPHLKDLENSDEPYYVDGPDWGIMILGKEDDVDYDPRVRRN